VDRLHQQLRIGPNAFVLVYAEKEFKGAMVSFGPGQEVSSLDELDFNDKIDSLRLVNSIKVFDSFRANEENKAALAPPEKKNVNKRRRKGRG